MTSETSSSSSKPTRGSPAEGLTGVADACRQTPRVTTRSAFVFAGLCVGLTIIVLAVHWPVLDAAAESLDDDVYLRSVYLIQNPGWDAVQRAFGEILEPSVPGYYEPLSLLSLMADYAMGGRPENLRPFHRTSLALHAANTVLIAVLLYMLFRQPYTAAMGALLFGVHPLTVEAVALVAQRKAVLAPFFSLLSLILYVQYASRRRWGLLTASVIAYVLALLSKPTSTPLPVLLVLLDFWPLRRLSPRALLEKVPYVVIGAASAAVTFLATRGTCSVTVPPLSHVPVRIGYLVAFYLGKIAWPVRLSSVYSLPEPFLLGNLQVRAAVLGTTALLIVLAFSLRWTRALLTGWLFFFAAILPVLGVVGYTWVAAADKHVYLPAVGLLLPLAYVLTRLWGGSEPPSGAARPKLICRTVVTAAVLAVGAAEASATRAYLSYWSDTERLYRHMIDVAPDSIYPRNNLAVALVQQGRIDEAIAIYREALQVAPPTAQTRTNLAAALGQRGRYEEAAAEIREALRLDPNYADAYNIQGNLMLSRGDLAGAIAAYDTALRLDPGLPETRMNLGVALIRAGRLEDAARALRAALRIQPLMADAHCMLADVLQMQGKPNEAAAEYGEALRIDPRNKEAAAKLQALRNAAVRRGGG